MPIKIILAILLAAVVVTPTLAADENPRCADYGETEVPDYDPVFEKTHIRCLVKPGFQCPDFGSGAILTYDPATNLSKIRCLAQMHRHTPRSIVFLTGKCIVAPSGGARISSPGNRERIPPGGYYNACSRGLDGECTIRCD